MRNGFWPSTTTRSGWKEIVLMEIDCTPPAGPEPNATSRLDGMLGKEENPLAEFTAPLSAVEEPTGGLPGAGPPGLTVIVTCGGVTGGFVPAGVAGETEPSDCGVDAVGAAGGGFGAGGLAAGGFWDGEPPVEAGAGRGGTAASAAIRNRIAGPGAFVNGGGLSESPPMEMLRL